MVSCVLEHEVYSGGGFQWRGAHITQHGNPGLSVRFTQNQHVDVIKYCETRSLEHTILALDRGIYRGLYSVEMLWVVVSW